MNKVAIVAVVVVVVLGLLILRKLRGKKSNPVYIGCYPDSPSRTFSTGTSSYVTVQKCNDLAKAAGSPYFGMQYWGNGKPLDKATCQYGADTDLTMIKARQPYQNNPVVCSIGLYGDHLGAAWSNAVYQTD